MRRLSLPNLLRLLGLLGLTGLLGSGLLGLLAPDHLGSLSTSERVSTVFMAPCRPISGPQEAPEPAPLERDEGPWGAPLEEAPAAPERLTIEVARAYPNGHFGARGRASVREGGVRLLDARGQCLGRTEVRPDGTWSFLSERPLPAPRSLRAVLERSAAASEPILPN